MGKLGRMSPIAGMVRTLIDAGTPPDVAATIVAEAYVAGRNSTGIPVDEMAEKRRAYDRERKRKSTGIPPDSTGTPQEALILTKDNNKKEKKVRTAKHPLPPDWQPSEDHFAYGAKRGYSRDGVLEKFEDMRVWAGSSGAQKNDWGMTLIGFMRRDAPKAGQAIQAASGVFVITPDSPGWNPWRSYFRDTGKLYKIKLMDKSASDGKPFTVQSEWPPGMAA
jgi:hypothetical protein